MPRGADFNVQSIKIVPILFANLPLASDCNGEIFSVPDYPMGATMLMSNGVTFSKVAIGIQSKILITDASGNATWNFTDSITNPGISLICENAQGNQPVIPSITSLSSTQLVINVKRAQVLPQNLATVLLGAAFNVFGGSSLTGIKVHAIAIPLTA